MHVGSLRRIQILLIVALIPVKLGVHNRIDLHLTPFLELRCPTASKSVQQTLMLLSGCWWYFLLTPNLVPQLYFIYCSISTHHEKALYSNHCSLGRCTWLTTNKTSTLLQLTGMSYVGNFDTLFP